MMMTKDYPRDLIGYGRNPPQANWPGRREDRGAVRAELRRRRRELRAARRPVVGDLSLRDHRRAGLRNAASVDGVDVRVRLARRRLAHPERVREARPAAHGVRRLDGAAPQPRPHPGLPRPGPRDRLPLVALDPLPAHERDARAPPHRDRHADHQGPDQGPVAARLVHRPRQPEHQAPGRRPRRLRIRQRLLRRRPAVLDAGREERRHDASSA